MPGSPDVVGVGANSIDYVAVIPEFPRASAVVSKLRTTHHAIVCGGQMVTALATCARFGLRCAYVGATGSDDNGRLVREALGRLDIDSAGVRQHEAANQFAYVIVDEATGERVIFWDRDERLNLDDHELPLDVLAACRLVHVDDTDERAAIAAASTARAHGVPVTSDIDRVTDRTLELIDAVSVAILAEHTPGTLTGRGDVTDAIGALPRRPDQVICVTLGNRGAIALDEQGLHRQPAFTVPVVDTTGAGDVFRAGFIYARLRGWPLDEQLRFANAAAAVSCTRLGALGSIPSLEEIEELLGR